MTVPCAVSHRAASHQAQDSGHVRMLPVSEAPEGKLGLTEVESRVALIAEPDMPPAPTEFAGAVSSRDSQRRGEVRSAAHSARQRRRQWRSRTSSGHQFVGDPLSVFSNEEIVVERWFDGVDRLFELLIADR